MAPQKAKLVGLFGLEKIAQMARNRRIWSSEPSWLEVKPGPKNRLAFVKALGMNF